MAAINLVTSAGQAKQLTRKVKLAYGFGDVGQAVVAIITGFFLPAFLLEVAGLRPALVGLIFFVSEIWDAVTDPLIGWLSDRTQTRWGRKRPWMLFGAVPFGLVYLLHWIVPDLGQTGLFWYYLVVALLLKTAFTSVSVPYSSLTAELTQDYDERTHLNQYRFSFSILGGMIAAVAHSQIIKLGSTEAAGYVISAVIAAFFIMLSTLVSFRFTYERSDRDTEGETHTGIRESLRIVLQNRPYLYVVGVYLLTWLALQFMQSNLLLYVRYWLGAESIFFVFIIILQSTIFLFLAFWAWVAKRIGKKRVYYIGVSIWILAVVLVFFVQQGQVIPVIILAFVGGSGVSVAFLVPWSMLPDVVEYDELQTGQRREGVYYGFFVFLQNVGLAGSIALSNFILDAVGYITPTAPGVFPVQPGSTLLALRLFVSLIPAVLLAISIPIARAYPITREIHAEIRRQLAERRQ